MKNIVLRGICLQILFVVFSLTVFNACEYKDVADADYPDEQVYIGGTYGNLIYKIDQITENENSPFRYTIDPANNRLVIPLAICRAAVASKTNVSVQLEIDNDTIAPLIESEVLVTEGDIVPDILPANKYELNTDVQIKKGEELGKFELSVDIPFLLNNLDKRFVLGIKIMDSNAKINESMSLIVVDILAAFVEANPDFTFEMNEKKPLDVAFKNTSTFCLDYEWDFGDGSPVINEKDPGTHTFPGVGIYNVKLTSTGTRGNTVTETKIVHIWEDVTTEYLVNPGNPFERAGLVSSGRVDALADWSYTQNVLSTYSSANDIYIGGFQLDNGGVMDFYANKSTGGALINAKIYQPVASLPSGTYYAGFTPFSFTGVNDCYFVVTKGNTLPDIENLATDPDVIGYYNWNENIAEDKYGVEFELTQPQDITIGFVVSNEEAARVKIKSVFLSR